MKRNIRGTALIMALFILALIASTVTALLLQFDILLQHTQWLINADKAQLASTGAYAWAEDLLTQNLLHQKIEVTPIISASNEGYQFKLESRIEDIQGLFNINNLVDPNAAAQFTRLFQLASPKTSMVLIKKITSNIQSFITSTVDHQLDEYYQNLHPPYQQSRHLFADISELRLVKGINAEVYKALSPYLCALPELTHINVNSAPLLVLMSLSPTMSQGQAQELISLRKNNPFKPESFFESYLVTKINLKKEGIIFVSNFFLIKTNVTVDNQDYVYTSLVKRTKDVNLVLITPIWQTQGS